MHNIKARAKRINGELVIVSEEGKGTSVALKFRKNVTRLMIKSENMNRNIRISIVEDDETIRNGYAYLIGATEGYEVVSTYCSYDEASKKIAADRPM
jgi:hypothetical protein